MQPRFPISEHKNGFNSVSYPSMAYQWTGRRDIRFTRQTHTSLSPVSPYNSSWGIPNNTLAREDLDNPSSKFWICCRASSQWDMSGKPLVSGIQKALYAWTTPFSPHRWGLECRRNNNSRCPSVTLSSSRLTKATPSLLRTRPQFVLLHGVD